MKPVKRILLLIDSLGPGGAQRQMVELARLLRSRGFDVKLITYYDIPFYKHLIQELLPVENIPNGKKLLPRFIHLVQSIRLYDPDVVISYLDTPNILACLTRLISGKYKVIVSERRYEPEFSLSSRVKYQIYRLSASIITNSYKQAEYIKMHAYYLSDKISTIINTVDLNRFKPVEYLANQQENISRVAVVSTVQARKNPINLIKAAAILRDHFQEKIIIHWFGKVLPEALRGKKGSSLFKEAITLIKDLHLESSFQFFEPVEDIERIYWSYDAICLASFSEGTPNAICEAMACGKPILASDICDNHLLVKENENGFLFDPADPASIAQAIHAFHMTDYKKRKLMAQNSRNMAVELFAENVFVEKYADLMKI
jgi:glycosyltransferase involved in cell wall biosynthesis